jgi:hypothetical protein
MTQARIIQVRPEDGVMIDVVRGPLARFELPWLLRHHDRVPVLAAVACLNGLVSIAIMSLLALLTG